MSGGGVADHLSTISAWRFITPPSDWPKGIVVNRRGERFCNEQVYGATLGHAMVEQQGGRAWLVLDARLRRQALRECLFGGLWAFQSLPALALMLLGAKRGPRIEALAGRIGADAATLRASWESYNAAARSGHGDPLGKSSDMCQPLERPPYYALDISIRLITCDPAGAYGLVFTDETGKRIANNQAHIQRKTWIFAR